MKSLSVVITEEPSVFMISPSIFTWYLKPPQATSDSKYSNVSHFGLTIVQRQLVHACDTA